MIKNIKIKVYLLILSIIFASSLISSALLFFYMNPESNIKIWFTVMILAIFLLLSSFFTLIIYFFKKVYYRWEIYLSNMNSSLRQWIFWAIYIIWITAFNATSVFSYKTWFLLFIILFFIELIFQSMKD
jgi:hypothetical protein